MASRLPAAGCGSLDSPCQLEPVRPQVGAGRQGEQGAADAAWARGRAGLAPHEGQTPPTALRPEASLNSALRRRRAPSPGRGVSFPQHTGANGVLSGNPVPRKRPRLHFPLTHSTPARRIQRTRERPGDRAGKVEGRAGGTMALKLPPRGFTPGVIPGPPPPVALENVRGGRPARPSQLFPPLAQQ